VAKMEEFFKIVVKQHYIPRLYLRKFKNGNSSNDVIKIFLSKNTKIFEEDISKIFYKDYFYTTITDYLNLIKILKDLLYEELEKSDKIFSKIILELKNEVDKIAEEAERKALLKSLDGNLFNIKRHDLLKKGANYYKEFPIYLEIFNPFKNTLNNSIFKVNNFLRKYKKINSLAEIKETSKSFYDLVIILKKNTQKSKKELENIKKKVEKSTKEDKSYENDDIQKDAAKNFNNIIYRAIKDVVSIISSILTKLDNTKDKATLEDKLGAFETTCIISKDELNSNNLEFDDNIKFKINKYILIQYYRYLNLNNNETWSSKIFEILECTDYKKLKKKNDLELVKLNGVIIKIDKNIFCTSDKPILYDNNTGILIFPFSPNTVYIVVKKYYKNLKSNILNLDFNEEEKLIKNINYLIKNNFNEFIISSEKEILFEEISKEDFIIELEETLKKYNLIKKE
jgi:hypothetical protein